MNLKSQSRMVSVNTFWRYTNDFVSHFRDFVSARRAKRLSRQFAERLFLAVTEVNGCRYCSYAHTTMALKAGMSQQDVDGMLGGDIASAPEWERIALLYAQHHAESANEPDPEAVERLYHIYGDELARDIQAHVRMAMIANTLGIALDRFLSRFRGNADASFTVWQELGVLVGLPFFFLTSVVGLAPSA